MKAPALTLLCLGSWGLAPFLCLACAGTVTPPDTTPVYAEDATKGVAPIPVEYASVNDPEVTAVDGADAPEQSPSEEAASKAAAPSDSKATAEASAAPETKDAPGTADETAPQPVAPPEPKETPAAPQPKGP